MSIATCTFLAALAGLVGYGLGIRRTARAWLDGHAMGRAAERVDRNREGNTETWGGDIEFIDWSDPENIGRA